MHYRVLPAGTRCALGQIRGEGGSDKEALIATWIKRPRLLAFRRDDAVFLGGGLG